MNNIDIFNQTQTVIQYNSILTDAAENAAASTKVYKEGFRSKRKVNKRMNVSFRESLTLIPAYEFACMGTKAAVLNFANPLTPGGGVLRGANAQEEYLCRATALYNCLTSPAAAEYYDIHRQICDRNNSDNILLATDAVIFSPDVPVIRMDADYFPEIACRPVQVLMPQDQWYYIDVITCAAPYFAAKQLVLPDGDLEQIFMRRIRNMLEVAIENNVQQLILGAFGCGAFNNPPQVVAGAFSKVLQEDHFKNAFSDVIFAVKRTQPFCENIEAFQNAFTNFPPTIHHTFSTESNKRRFF